MHWRDDADDRMIYGLNFYENKTDDAANTNANALHSLTHRLLSFSPSLSHCCLSQLKFQSVFGILRQRGGPVIIYTRASHRYFLFLPATAAASSLSLCCCLFFFSFSLYFLLKVWLCCCCYCCCCAIFGGLSTRAPLTKTITKTKNDFCRLVPHTHTHTHTCTTRTPLCTSTWYGGSNEVNAATGNSRAAPCNCGS